MKVIINKQEGYTPYLYVKADEQVSEVATIDQWIRMLQLGKAWLRQQNKKPAK